MNHTSRPLNHVAAPVALVCSLVWNQSHQCYRKGSSGKSAHVSALSHRSLRNRSRLEWCGVYRGVGGTPLQSMAPYRRVGRQVLRKTPVRSRLAFMAQIAHARARDRRRDLQNLRKPEIAQKRIRRIRQGFE